MVETLLRFTTKMLLSGDASSLVLSSIVLLAAVMLAPVASFVARVSLGCGLAFGTLLYTTLSRVPRGAGAAAAAG